ncbi:hypothetical protein [Nonlabens sp.]|nr:hypothetical protein [Nonlabens sp.]
MYRLETIDIIPDLLGKQHIFENYDACLHWILANVEDTVPSPEN